MFKKKGLGFLVLHLRVGNKEQSVTHLTDQAEN